MTERIIHGDCLDVMRAMDADSIDAIVTDPPYELGFMGKAWDRGGISFHVELWTEALRVAKPGTYLLAFGGTRTYHRMTCAIEDAGWEIHDCLTWLYGSGFPKHKSKLKPAWEPIVMARKPAPKATLLNIDACRIDMDGEIVRTSRNIALGSSGSGVYGAANVPGTFENHPSGRWPANVCCDEDAAAAIDAQSGERGSTLTRNYSGQDQSLGRHGVYGKGHRENSTVTTYADTGGASRFYFVAKHTPGIDDVTLCGICAKHYIASANPTGELCGHATNAGPTSNHDAQALSHARGDARLCEPHGGADIPASANGHATNAVSGSPITPATGGDSVRADVEDSPIAQTARAVRSAANLCNECATAIARALVALRNRRDPALALGLVSISEPKKQTLLRSLALYAETLDSTDTIPTIASLKLWFGYARDAIVAITTQESDDPSFASGQRRFGYHSKASRSEREAGLEGFDLVARSSKIGQLHEGVSAAGNKTGRYLPRANAHPTVKPVALMRWLVRLVTPPGGTVLDPFAGSGTTGIAAVQEDRSFIGIENEKDYVPITDARIRHVADQGSLFRPVE